MTPLSPTRIQDTIRETLERSRLAVRVPPYTAYLDPREPLPFLNYALPDPAPRGRLVPIVAADAAADAGEKDPLARLQQEFRARGRTPRVEYVEECHPQLAKRLEQAGFERESRAPLMACTDATWRPAPEVPGLELAMLGPASEWPQLRAHLLVQQEAFGVKDAPALPETAHADHWPTLGYSAAILARLHGESVGAAGLTPPVLGLAEVVGVATVPAHRRKGIAAAVVGALARAALQAGVEAVYLNPGDERTHGVYARAGFRPCATMLAYRA